MNTATYVTKVTVTDPDTGKEIELEIWKEPVTGGLLGVAVEFILHYSDTINNPYHKSRLRAQEAP